MSDQFTEMIAENGMLHNVAATTAGKLNAWSDQLYKTQQWIEQHCDMSSYEVRDQWGIVDYLVCAMREQEAELDRALGITQVVDGQVVPYLPADTPELEQQPLLELPAPEPYEAAYEPAEAVQAPERILVGRFGAILCPNDGHAMTLVTVNSAETLQCPNGDTGYDAESKEYYYR